MALKVKNGQKILFIGDSITDCGRRDSAAPLGNGYVKLFADMLITREPAKRVSIINKGISGDNVVGLKNRWSDDVLRHRPDWLSIKIGINDLHSTFGNPNGVTPKVFAEAYDEILSRTRKALPKCRLLLIQPFYISIESSPNTWRKQVQDLLPTYLSIVAHMSRKYGTRLVKTHAMFQELLRHHEADTFCPEPVHPNLTGHLAMAESVYAALSR
ncbi:MAG: SGNH/GDSL hydrolase family protein [Planctomycetota bacterium]|nr:SGNH/GDSL hydrolase family protein [Planctomycetota bacterium]